MVMGVFSSANADNNMMTTMIQDQQGLLFFFN